MRFFWLGIAMLVAVAAEIHRLGNGEPDTWMVNTPLEKIFAMQRCALGATFLVFVGAVMSGVRP